MTFRVVINQHFFQLARASTFNSIAQLHFRKARTTLLFYQLSSVLSATRMAVEKLLQNNKWDFKKTCFFSQQSAI
jgi:hypothetical protein